MPLARDLLYPDPQKVGQLAKIHSLYRTLLFRLFSCINEDCGHGSKNWFRSCEIEITNSQMNKYRFAFPLIWVLVTEIVVFNNDTDNVGSVIL